MYINPSQVGQLVEVKRGDTSRILYEQLLLAGVPINLSGSAVSLLIHDPVSEATTRRTATITVAASGSVQYQFEAEDIATTGSRVMEFEVIFQDGKELTIPTTAYYKLNILPDLG
jgi:hypothetical protein